MGSSLAYSAKLLNLFGSSIVSYLPLWEPSGAVAADIGGRGLNGAYTAVALGQPGVGDGRTAASFDGSTSFMNWYSAGLAAAFNGAEGTLIVWAKVSAAGVWTDGANHAPAAFAADGNNQIYFYKRAANDIAFFYVAGATTVSLATTLSYTAFFHVVLTWSKSGDAFKVYINGVQLGTTQTGLGTWVGAIASTNAVLGAADTVVALPWLGSLAHALLLNRAATPAEVMAAYLVP